MTFLEKRSSPKKSLARTSASTTKSSVAPQAHLPKTVLWLRHQHGRRFAPPMSVSVRHQKVESWSHLSGLNRRPHPYHGCALPTELRWHIEGGDYLWVFYSRHLSRSAKQRSHVAGRTGPEPAAKKRLRAVMSLRILSKNMCDF